MMMVVSDYDCVSSLSAAPTYTCKNACKDKNRKEDNKENAPCRNVIRVTIPVFAFTAFALIVFVAPVVVAFVIVLSLIALATGLNQGR